ncbi:MAG: RtcB family protein, partial [Acidimicrobiales bacterium]
MPTTINPKLVSWASDIELDTIRQAEKTARLPIVEGRIERSVPAAHVGIGATVGSVIPTKGAVIPSAVGVDIGCGMIAAELDVTEDQLPDDLEPLLGLIERAVPAGVGKGPHQGRQCRWPPGCRVTAPPPRCRRHRPTRRPSSSERWARATTSSSCAST